MDYEENLKVVQQAYEAFGRGDIRAVLDVLGDDIEWIVPGSRDVPYAGRRRGRREVAKFFGALGRALDFEAFEPREFLPHGDAVVVLGDYRTRVKPTGRAATSEWAMVFRVRDGKIVRFQEYADTEDLAGAHRAA